MVNSLRIVNIAKKLFTYKQENGTQWKAKLRELSNNGTNRDEDLQLFRNRFLDLLPKIKNDFDYADIVELIQNNNIEVG